MSLDSQTIMHAGMNFGLLPRGVIKTVYPEATRDLDRRWHEHLASVACRATTLDPPPELAHSEEYETFSEVQDVVATSAVVPHLRDEGGWSSKGDLHVVRRTFAVSAGPPP